MTNQNTIPPLEESPKDDNEQAIPINVRDAIKGSIQRAKADHEEVERINTERLALQDDIDAQDEVVKEYEERYYGDDKGKNTNAIVPSKPKNKSKQDRSLPQDVSEDEKLWAAIAHASALLSVGLLIFSAGVGSIFSIFVPLVIYLVYREKSEFVAYHALQAFAAQAVGILGFVALLIGLTTAWVVMLIISALLIVVLIGIPMIVVVALAGLVAIGATFLLPLGLLVYSMMGATAAYAGRDFQYPWISDWVDEQIYPRLDTL